MVPPPPEKPTFLKNSLVFAVFSTLFLGVGESNEKDAFPRAFCTLQA